MLEVCRGNVYLDISEDEVEKYLAKGFSIVDPKTDRIIKQSIPTSLSELQKAYSEHVDTINQLNLEVARLKSKLQAQAEGEKPSASPKGEVEKAAEPEATSDWDDWDSAEEVEEEKPKKSKKSKKSSLS